MDRKELEGLLGLDFGKYEYYMDFVPYRWADGKTEYFDVNSKEWKSAQVDIQKKFTTPFEFNVDLYEESEKNKFIDVVLELVNRKKGE